MNLDWLNAITDGKISLLPVDADATEIVIGGDLCPIGRPEKQAQNGKANEVLADLAPFFKAADLAIVNLECPLTKSDGAIKKTGPTLYADPITIDILKEAGISAVTLANNHVLDQGLRGLSDTIELCHKNRIQTVGTGLNLHEAAKPLILESHGRRIAIFNIADHEYSIATRTQAGANPLDPALNYQHIRDAKQNNEHIIVIIHAGNEHYSLPSPQLRNLFHFYADAGATAVIGHHPHCPGGIEIYKGIPLVYSLGNLVFDEDNSSFQPWYEGFILKIRITDEGVSSLELIPYSQYREQSKVQILEAEAKTAFLQVILRLSRILTNDEEVESQWDKFCKTHAKGYLYSFFRLSKVQRFLLKKNLFRKKILPNSGTQSKLLNLIRCDAHRNVLINLLQNIKTK